MRDQILNHFQGNFKAFYGKYLSNIKTYNRDECQSLCPFHDDHHPSFNVNEEENYWYCFACETGGSIIDFWSAPVKGHRN